MQLRKSQNLKILLNVIVIFGSFFVSISEPVHASSDNLSQKLMMMDVHGEEKDCYKQACPELHATCQQYCLNVSEHPSIEAAILIGQNDARVASVSKRFETLPIPDQRSLLVAIPNRVPPAHKLLRSVIKLE